MKGFVEKYTGAKNVGQDGQEITLSDTYPYVNENVLMYQKMWYKHRKWNKKSQNTDLYSLRMSEEVAHDVTLGPCFPTSECIFLSPLPSQLRRSIMKDLNQCGSRYGLNSQK